LLQELRIGFKLEAIAVSLFFEKLFASASFVSAGLVIDYPSKTFLVHECSVHAGVLKMTVE
jgi:hypothetical protein